MGTVGGVIQPNGTWPDVDRNGVEYVWDETRLLR
jgi:hypothetical protein